VFKQTTVQKPNRTRVLTDFKLFKINPPKYKIIKVLECESCGYRRTEEGARKGEYIYKEVGTCPQCGKELLITAIYREKIGKGP